MQHPFETLWQKNSNLAKILGQMVRISQKFIIILSKMCLKISPCDIFKHIRRKAYILYLVICLGHRGNKGGKCKQFYYES